MSHLFCTVCSEAFELVDYIHITVCGHMFHSNCINAWLLQGSSKSCPQCRAECNDSNIIHLNLEAGGKDCCANIDPLDNQLKFIFNQIDIRENELNLMKQQVRKLKGILKCLKSIAALEKNILSQKEQLQKMNDELEVQEESVLELETSSRAFCLD